MEVARRAQKTRRRKNRELGRRSDQGLGAAMARSRKEPHQGRSASEQGKRTARAGAEASPAMGEEARRARGWGRVRARRRQRGEVGRGRLEDGARRGAGEAELRSSAPWLERARSARAPWRGEHQTGPRDARARHQGLTTGKLREGALRAAVERKHRLGTSRHRTRGKEGGAGAEGARRGTLRRSRGTRRCREGEDDWG
jgi:hypothetical protein